LALESARAIWRITNDAEAQLRVAMQLLDDADDTIKAHALDLLGELGTAARPALADLQRLIGDELEYVRRHAREALEKIEPVQLL
jgi:HEAT repeat protein